MPSIQQPLLAQEYDPELHASLFPLYGTAKIDGIRAYIDQGTVWARSNKPIPNRFIQEVLPLYLPNGTDIELGAGVYSAQDHFQKTTSVVMSDAKPITDLHVYILDYIQEDGHEILPYYQRIAYIDKWRKAHCQLTISDSPVYHVPTNGKKCYNVNMLREVSHNTKVMAPVKLSSPSQVSLYLKHCLKLGYEGIVLRDPQGGYHFGRPQQKDGLLLRHKPLTDGEAVIVGFTELEHNDNEPTISPTGRTVRSTCISGKVAGNTLGSFLVRDNTTGVEFSVGGGKGLTQELRKEVWNNRETYLGTILRYSFLSCGTKDKPRQPKFTGFRDAIDLS